MCTTTSVEKKHICNVCGKKQTFGYPGDDPEFGPAVWDCENYCAQIRAEEEAHAQLAQTHDVNADCSCQSGDNPYGCVECDYTTHPRRL
jgi:hypothetical protein